LVECGGEDDKASPMVLDEFAHDVGEEVFEIEMRSWDVSECVVSESKKQISEKNGSCRPSK